MHRPMLRTARTALFLSTALVSGVASAAPVSAEPADREPWEPAFEFDLERAGGMAWDGERLWLVDRSVPDLVALDPATGEIRERLPSPGPWPEGMAWDGERLWVSDSEEKKIYGLNLGTRRVDRRFDSPVETPQGLAWDGERLWLADGTQLHRISSDDGTTLASFPAPTSGGVRPGEMLGLAWERVGAGPRGEAPRGYLWVVDRHRDQLFRVSADRGDVVDMFPTPGPYPVGAAFVDGRLLVADRENRRVDRIDPRALPMVVRTAPFARTLTFVHELQNFGPGTVTTADLYLALPASSPGQQLEGEPELNPVPTEILTDGWGQRVAHYRRDELIPGTSRRTEMTVRFTAYNVRWHIDPERVGALSGVPTDIRSRFTRDASKFLLGDPVIRAAVDEALGEERNPYRMVRRLARYVQDHLFYELAGGWNTAPAVLTRGNGSCSEYTFLFLALCRAAGLPARYAGAVVVRQDDSSTDSVFHRWPEVYYPGYGWVPADAQAGDSPTPEKRAEAMMSLPGRFLVTTLGGGDSEYLRWNYNYDTQWECDGYCKMVERVWGDWSPDREAAPVDSTAAGETGGAGICPPAP